MSIVLFTLWMGLSAGLLLLFFYAAYLNWRNRQPTNLELGELIPSFLPVNTETLAQFAELARQSECPADEVSRRQGEHYRETSECLRRMTHNAALLQRLGYAQMQSPNPLIRSLAEEMIDAGVQVRFYSFVALTRLWLRSRLSFRLPALSSLGDVKGLLCADLIPAYDLLKDKAGNLTCLKFSSFREDLVESL
jgi:hypothetical protein